MNNLSRKKIGLTISLALTINFPMQAFAVNNIVNGFTDFSSVTQGPAQTVYSN